jgi:FtsP/CotA-like multicopper oxidase with cupredoxin domain
VDVRTRRLLVAIILTVVLAILLGANPALGKSTKAGVTKIKGRPTMAQRQQAARLQAAAVGASALAVNTTMAPPLSTPDYFGTVANYANSPLPASVSIIGDGMGALATVTYDATTGQVTGFAVLDGGSGYTAPNTSVSVIGGGGGGGQGIPTIANGVITNVTVTNGGVGYSLPLVTITDATTATIVPAVATAVVGPSGVISSIAVVSGGSGYVSPVVTITDLSVLPTVTATASATANDGVITAITPDPANLGSGYGSAAGIRKFVDTLPGLGAGAANDLGQYIPVAVADTSASAPNRANWVTTDPRTGKKYPAADYFWIGVVQYTEKLHADLPATTLRGYVQIDTDATLGATQATAGGPWTPGATSVTGSKRVALTYPGGAPILYDPDGSGPLTAVQVYAVDDPHYLGPTIVAQKDHPVRVKFSDFLPTKTGGDLFLPVDTSIMGAGKGPDGATNFSKNRATLHLHGGTTPWISDGTQHQWTAPYGASEKYPKGVSVRDVPDMVASGTGGSQPGDLTFYYTNQQSARLAFYHDHAYGITRLNVYAGEAAGYLIQDAAEASLPIPADQIPLIIQDKTFVPSTPQLAGEDPTWDLANFGGYGNLWFPHVYMPNQNPSSINGANPMGRWDYGPWFWPPNTNIKNGPLPNPLAGQPGENATNPGTDNPSIIPEAFMDTALVNGTAYPVLKVDPKAYRFRILNASNDRNWNLSLYQASASGAVWNGSTLLNNGASGEVPMVPAVQNPALPFPKDWTTATDGAGVRPDILDGRLMGVPDPRNLGPSWVQIGTEGGLLPNPATIQPKPTGYQYNLRNIVVLNVSKHSLFLGPAERADVVVDFSKYAGKTLILYNDGPAPVPAGDPRVDFYTGNPDLTAMGGAPSTQPGYGPNTRTIMQIQVAPATNPPAYDPTPLNTALPAAYAASQPAPIVGQAEYNAAFKANYPADPFVRIQDTQTSFSSTMVGALTVTNGGGGYTSAPTIAFTPPLSGITATAVASLSPAAVGPVTVANGGSGYTTAPTVAFTGGGGTGAAGVATLSATGSVKTITLNSGGSGYLAAPTISFTGGGGTGAAATATVRTSGSRNVTAVTLTNGGSGYTSAPTVVITPVNGGSGAAATTTLGRAVASVTVTNGGANYTSAPTVAFSGGAGTGAAATAALAPRTVASLTLTNPGSGYTAAPTVSFNGGGGTLAAATASLANVTMGLQPKAIQELFDPDYGRMNSLLGTEIPNTTGLNQTTIPFFNIDPSTEVINTAKGTTPPGQLIQTMPDGTQIWKITHNGVDTHTIHWHMFNVQVINRVGWDGAIRFPDANEFGWKESVRMNPLEDVIIAVKPIVPQVPWSLPNSIRPLDPSMPLNATVGTNFSNVDPNNNPVTVDNRLVNFGWEYVWHCHLLGHEENDMMRPMAVGVAPDAPGTPTAVKSGSGVRITFVDNSNNETGFQVQRATSAGGPWTTVGTVNRPAPTLNAAGAVVDAGLSTGTTVTFTDGAPIKKATDFYRVLSVNLIGDTQPGIGFPTETVPSPATVASNGVAM